MTDTEKEILSTRERVIEAANTMLREGRAVKEITARAVYDRIKYGSMKTISASLKKWDESLGAYIVSLEAFDSLPPKTTQALLEAFAGIQEAALDQATQALARYRAETDLKVEDAVKARKVALEAKALAETTTQDLKSQVDQLIARIESLNDQLKQEQTLREKAENTAERYRQEASDTASKASAERAVNDNKIENLAQQIIREKEVSAETETRLTELYDRERTGREKDNRDADKAINDLRNTIDALNQRLHEVESEKDRCGGQLEQASDERQRLQEMGMSLNEKLNDAVAKLVEMKTNYDQLKEQRTQVEAKRLHAEEALIEKESAIVDLEAKLAKAIKGKKDKS